MANALPHAIGARAASGPSRQVISLSGDGELPMLHGALAFVELEMKAAGIVTFGTDLDNPDFAAIATAAGLFGAKVEKADEVSGEGNELVELAKTNLRQVAAQ